MVWKTIVSFSYILRDINSNAIEVANSARFQLISSFCVGHYL